MSFAFSLAAWQADGRCSGIFGGWGLKSPIAGRRTTIHTRGLLMSGFVGKNVKLGRPKSVSLQTVTLRIVKNSWTSSKVPPRLNCHKLPMMINGMSNLLQRHPGSKHAKSITTSWVVIASA